MILKRDRIHHKRLEIANNQQIKLMNRNKRVVKSQRHQWEMIQMKIIKSLRQLIKTLLLLKLKSQYLLTKVKLNLKYQIQPIKTINLPVIEIKQYLTRMMNLHNQTRTSQLLQRRMIK